MAWSLGSESRDTTGSNAAPAGTGHAVDPGAGLTACGRPVRSLHLWEEVPWARVRMIGLPTCPDCDANTD